MVLPIRRAGRTWRGVGTGRRARGPRGGSEAHTHATVYCPARDSAIHSGCIAAHSIPVREPGLTSPPIAEAQLSSACARGRFPRAEQNTERVRVAGQNWARAFRHDTRRRCTTCSRISRCSRCGYASGSGESLLRAWHGPGEMNGCAGQTTARCCASPRRRSSTAACERHVLVGFRKIFGDPLLWTRQVNGDAHKIEHGLLHLTDDHARSVHVCFVTAGYIGCDRSSARLTEFQRLRSGRRRPHAKERSCTAWLQREQTRIHLQIRDLMHLDRIEYISSHAGRSGPRPFVYSCLVAAAPLAFRCWEFQRQATLARWRTKVRFEVRTASSIA
jgi:hypothetical protein